MKLEGASMLAKSLLISVAALVAPIHAVLGAMLLLVFVDAVLGMWAARKRGERITSAGLSRTGVKLGLYPAICIVVFAFEALLIGPLVPLLHAVPVVGSILQALAPYPLAKMAGAWLCLTEAVSLGENADVVMGRAVFGPLVAKVAPAKLLGGLVKALASKSTKGTSDGE